MTNKGFLNRSSVITLQTNANSENARSRMEASSAGKHEYGDTGSWVKYWARLGCWISPRYGPFSPGTRFETYKPFISLILTIFWAAVNRGYWISGYGGTPVFECTVNSTANFCIFGQSMGWKTHCDTFTSGREHFMRPEWQMLKSQSSDMRQHAVRCKAAVS
jgi:hypothetical protein